MSAETCSHPTRRVVDYLNGGGALVECTYCRSLLVEQVEEALA